MKSAWNSKRMFLATAVAGILFVFAAVCGAPTVAAAPRAKAADASAPGYHLLKTIPVSGDTFWDYVKFQPSTNRLFISRGNHVDVLNVETGKIVGNIGGMEGIHGIVLAPEFNKGFVTDGEAAKVWIFNLKTLKVIGSAPADKDADGEVYDPASKRVFTMNGDSQSSTVIDAKTGKVVGHIALGGQPEFPVADGRGHVYANIESTSEIIEIDSHAMKITHRWPLAPGEHPSGLAIDAKHHILFSGCRNQKMVIMDADNGKVLATEPIGVGVDATRFDAGTDFAFASNGFTPSLTVVHEDSPTSFQVVENVKTEIGARTMALNPKNHDVYLVTADIQRIEHPAPHTRPFRLVPGTFRVLIYGMR
ncbi:MAG TPA: YncE family protein [Candidatus Dormibacteraeota bacterium]|nr:YncE family protein [Candidatus Dormibacteraeota bacterium]